MVRLSSPLSSRLLLAGSYAAIGGLILYFSIVFYFHDIIYEDPHKLGIEVTPLNLGVNFLAALGPIFGVIVASIPFFPFTFVYASLVCPSRITLTNTELRAKFAWKETIYPMSELRDVRFKTASDKEFIILKIAGKSLKAEIDLGAYREIRNLIPTDIAAKVALRS